MVFLKSFWLKSRYSLISIALFWHTPLLAAEVTVAVAANFTKPMEKIEQAFEQATGHTIRASYSSMGKFYAQIKNGAPFDVLVAADQATPIKLVQDRLALPETQFTYAIGRLVLWSTQENWIDQEGQVLQSGDFRHIAVANPKLAVYGQAAIAVMKKMGLLEKLEPRFVLGETITQAYQFVATGNAELGFVALSQIYLDGQFAAGSRWLVPDTLHPPIYQDAVLLKHGQHNAAANALLEYLKSDAARQIILAFGYEL